MSELQKGCWQCIYNERGMVEYLKFIKGSWDNAYVLKKLKKSFLEKPKFWASPYRHKMAFLKGNWDNSYIKKAVLSFAKQPKKTLK